MKLDDYNILFYRKSKEAYSSEKEMREEWDAIVSMIEEGYNYIEPELENDLFVRNDIELILLDKDLNLFEQHKFLKKIIFEIDNRLKKMIIDNPKISRKENSNWWENVLLVKGKEEYVNDIKNTYKIDIELVK
jgi:hypothetical protein